MLLSGMLLILGLYWVFSGAATGDLPTVVLGGAALVLSLLPLLGTARRSPMALYEGGVIVGTGDDEELPLRDLIEAEVGQHTLTPSGLEHVPYLQLRWPQRTVVVAQGQRSVGQDVEVADLATLTHLLQRLGVPFAPDLAHSEVPPPTGPPPTGAP